MTIGESMRSKRKAAGLSIAELGKKSGVNRQNILWWEHDRNIPRLDNLELCADVLQISIDEYVGHEVQGLTVAEKEQKRNNVLKTSINTFGRPRVEDVAIEEMSELIKAIIKNRRSPNKEYKESIREEIADVFIMLTQLRMMYGDVDEIIDQKVERLEKMIGRYEL